MGTKVFSDYENALQLANAMPRFYLGQEVKTRDGNGIIVDLKMNWDGLYIEPNSAEAVVWFSTESSVNRINGKWVGHTYKLTELSII